MVGVGIAVVGVVILVSRRYFTRAERYVIGGVLTFVGCCGALIEAIRWASRVFSQAYG